MTKPFHFLITYFKGTGKYYTTALVKWDIRCLSNMPFSPYYHDAISKLRGLKDAGGPGALPGLSSDGWDGPICIQAARPKQSAPENSTSRDDYYGDGVPHILLTRI